MIVDIDDGGRIGRKTLLHDRGGQEVVGEATNGREAMQLARRLAALLFITDVGMPTGNGFDATKRTGTLVPDTTIIALSARADAPLFRGGSNRRAPKASDIERRIVSLRTRAGEPWPARNVRVNMIR